MDAETHNKYLAYCHLGYAALQLLMLIVMGLGLVSFILMSQSHRHGPGPPPAFFAIIFLFVLAFQTLMCLPSALAGYGLLKKKSWARTVGLVAGIVAAMSFPIGTAVCVYSCWFLFGETGRTFYGEERPVAHLNAPGQRVSTGAPHQEPVWTPPEPPNWRD